MQLNHNTPIGEHKRRWKTTELVTKNYWQLGVTNEVTRYVKGYNVHKRHKNRSEVPIGKLVPNMIPEKPQIHILANFITKLLLAWDPGSF